MAPEEPVSHQAVNGPPSSAGRPSRVWFLRLLLLAGGIAVALLVGEIAVRLLGADPELAVVSAGAFRLSENPVLRYELFPGARDGDIKINPDGMRDRSYTVQKPAGTFRIACIGDSICAGFHLDAAEAFGARLEQLLNRYYATPDQAFEVLNFGVTGYNITQAVENLRVRGLKYDPDVIVYAYCLNDVQEYSFEFETLQARLTAAERSHLGRMLRGDSWLLLHSRLYALCRYSWESHALPSDGPPEIRPDEQFRHLGNNTYEQYFRSQYNSQAGWGRVLDGLERLAEVSRRHNMNVYLAIFPIFGDFEAYPLEDVHRKVATAAKQRSLRVLDLLGGYRAFSRMADGPFALDDLHPNAAGHALAAVAILRALLAGERALATSPCLDPMALGDQPEALAASLLLRHDRQAGQAADTAQNPRGIP